MVEFLKSREEMKTIKKKAIADGTFMKAPNGKPTNLTERQWLQVRTTNFKKWFGDWENDPANASKVVDENGEPLVVYHGSKVGGFTTFREYYEKGTFFSTSKRVGEIYADEKRRRLYSTFINARTPLIIDNKGKDWHQIDSKDAVEAVQKLYGMSKEEAEKELSTEETLTTDGIAGTIARFVDEGNSPYDAFILKNVIETNDDTIATDVITMRANQVKSATNNNGNFSLTDDNIQAAYGKKREIYNPDLKPQEINAIQKHIETLSKETDTSNGLWHIVSYTRGTNKGKTFAYKFNTSLYQYEQNRKDKHDGFEILSKIDLTSYSDVEFIEIKKGIENGIIRNQESFNKWSESHIEEQRHYSSDSIDAEVRRANAYNDRLDNQTSKGKSQRRPNTTSSTENKGESEIATFTTPQGEIYGFVDKEGNMYLDESVITPEHPIHEYTHLWDRVVQQKNPELWNRGVQLMKQTPLWNEFLNDDNYGKQWQARGITGERLDNLIASEVHARLTGVEGEKILNQLAKEKGAKGIIGKLKQWILDMWRSLGETLGVWSKEELNDLTLENFTHMTIRDFAAGNVDVK